MKPILSVRPSSIAGSWYSSNSVELRHELEGYLASARIPELKGDLIGIIAPHAGYFYSGDTAGYAYRAIMDMQFDLCVVVSPLHAYLPNPLLTTAHEAYTTPLGNVTVDLDMLHQLNQQLINAELNPTEPLANDREHSLEIQLPFLQTALKEQFHLLPLMIRSDDPQYLIKVAAILADLIRGKRVLLVASTDLAHFYDETTANSYDQVMLKRMSDFSPEGVLEAEANHEGFACGSGAVALVLWTAKALGANQVTLLHHSTSARASKDHTSVVGYGALAITRHEDN